MMMIIIDDGWGVEIMVCHTFNIIVADAAHPHFFFYERVVAATSPCLCLPLLPFGQHCRILRILFCIASPSSATILCIAAFAFIILTIDIAHFACVPVLS